MSVATHPVSLRKVTEDEADIRLDRWFRRHFPAVTQGAIQKLCRTGQVRVDEPDAAEPGDRPRAASPVQRQVTRLERAFNARPKLRAVPTGS